MSFYIHATQIKLTYFGYAALFQLLKQFLFLSASVPLHFLLLQNYAFDTQVPDILASIFVVMFAPVMTELVFYKQKN